MQSTVCQQHKTQVLSLQTAEETSNTRTGSYLVGEVLLGDQPRPRAAVESPQAVPPAAASRQQAVQRQLRGRGRRAAAGCALAGARIGARVGRWVGGCSRILRL